MRHQRLDARLVEPWRLAQLERTQACAVRGEECEPHLFAHEVGAIQGEVREMRKPAERAERDRVELATVV